MEFDLGRLKAERVANGLEQSDVAELVGIERIQRGGGELCRDFEPAMEWNGVGRGGGVDERERRDDADGLGRKVEEVGM